MTESIRKLSNFNFSGQKPCTRIISSTMHPFLHFLRAINEISYMKQHQRKGCYGRPTRQTSKSLNFTKLNLTHDDFTVFTQFLGNLKFGKFFLTPIRNCLWYYYRVFSIPDKFEIYQVFSDSHKNLSLVLLQITNYIYRP